MSLEETSPNKNNKTPARKKTKQKKDDLSPALEDALTNFLKTHADKKNKKINNMKSLELLLNQYLNSFILLGYSQDTRQLISLVNAKNEQQADSLSTALNKFIASNYKGPIPPI